MKTMLLCLMLAGLASLAQAQAPAASPSPDVPKADASDIGKSILEQELEPPPGGYTYNAQGRRDPFISMIKPVAPQGLEGDAPAGLPRLPHPGGRPSRHREDVRSGNRLRQPSRATSRCSRAPIPPRASSSPWASASSTA